MRLIDADELKRKAQRVATESWKMKVTARTETVLNQFIDWIDNAPTIQSEPHEIGYSECANVMLKMWIDNVLTDGEYNRIMDKLNTHWTERSKKHVNVNT